MGDQFCLKWNNHQNTLISVFDALLGTESLVDCTLVAGGQFLKGHKVVLSACSPLLETLLGQHSEKHPILILKDIKFHELRAMMDYMYRGEVNISQDQLDSFLRAAESLQIKGLTDQGGGGDSKGGGATKSEAAASPPTKRRRRASPEPEEESQASDVTSDSKPYIQPHVVTPHISTTPIMPQLQSQTSNSQPQDRLKTEPPDIITPKQEYIEGQHSDVEDLTLDDEEEYTMDMATQPGTSHGPPPNTPQTFSNWQAHTQALDRTNDEVFMAAQNAINNQNNAQGEAEYVGDLPHIVNELHAAVVLAKQGPARIASIDSSKALNLKGVVAFYSAKDVPGQNNMPAFYPQFVSDKEEVFCSGDILYAGQPIGMIVAESHRLALEAADLVDIKYTNKKKPLLSIRDVINSGDTSRIHKMLNIPAKHKGEDVKNVIKNEYEVGGQYHYTIEPQSCVVVPNEGQLDCYPSVQGIFHPHSAIAQFLNIPKNKINIKIKRVGGAYGCKISRGSIAASMCALAALKQNKPVRLVFSMESNTAAIGKRAPFMYNYEVSVDENGKIQMLNVNMYKNTGITRNDIFTAFIMESLSKNYDTSTWNINLFDVITDTPPSCWARAPGTFDMISFMENIMDDISNSLNLDPTQVRLTNMSDENIKKILTDWKNETEYDKRLGLIEQYNKQNRWKKRGLSLISMSYPITIIPGVSSCYISILAGDGTVQISLGAVEIGQGLNTKVAQTAAFKLGVDLSIISVKATNSLTGPNSLGAYASIASDCASAACMQACEKLNKRLEPIRKLMKPNYSWSDLINKAAESQVTLSEHHDWKFSDGSIKNYLVYGVCTLEVEIDVLTGKHIIRRVDIMEDVGDSLNPLIDVGQIEGGFVMGLGFYTSEEIKYDPETGALLTNRSWNYFPPGAKDIPVDFRIKFKANGDNPVGFLGSKATGEPGICLSVSLLSALRNALKSARKDANLETKQFKLNIPCTRTSILKASGTVEQMFEF